MYNQRTTRYHYVILFSILFLVTSCKPEPHSIIPVKKMKINSKMDYAYEYDLKNIDKDSVTFYKLELKFNGTSKMSSKDMEFVRFKPLFGLSKEEISKVKILNVNHDKFILSCENQRSFEITQPENLKFSGAEFMLPAVIQFPIAILAKMKFNSKDSQAESHFSDHAQFILLGMESEVNMLDDDDIEDLTYEIDWEKMFKDKHNMHKLYSQGSLSSEFKVQVKPKD